ncbi:MAG: lactate utilization protein, partial [Desulfobacteraceae bacterium]|nr:lactate utilization protein [Desulfobacteraceae bacterium]
MENPIENYWKTRLAELKETLTENNFEVFVAENTDEAKSIVLEKIIPEIAPKSVSWGGSLTFVATGLYDVLKNNNDLSILDSYDKTLSPDESLERR